MTLRIFRKDCRQLWPLITVVTIAQAANAALWFVLGPFKEPRGLVTVASLFSVATMVGMTALIVAVVQQDVLPGVSQDWLVRPIHRSDLLRAKLLFVVLVVQVPVLLADLAHGLAAGFALRDALSAAVSRSAFMLLVFDMPVIALAAMTTTLVQVAASILVIWLVVVAGIFVGILARAGAPPVFAASGIQWMTPAFWSVLACAAAAATIPLQYLRRATRQSRQIVAGVVLIAPILSWSTWDAAFSVQRWLSSNPAEACSIAIAFDLSAGKEAGEPASISANTVLLPLRVSGLSPESIVMNDRADARIVDRDGVTLFRGRTKPTLGYGDDLSVRTVAGGDVRTHQRIVLPSGVYARVHDRDVRLEVNYSLTLFRMEASVTMAPLNGEGRSGAFGWCKTKLDADGDEITLGCVTAKATPTCVTVTLENPLNRRRNPPTGWCAPDYTPYPAHLYPDALSQFGFGIPFRDHQRLAQYPVDGLQLGQARVVLQSYRPVVHFTRRLVISDIRLGDGSS
jgi:hypothetical protein